MKEQKQFSLVTIRLEAKRNKIKIPKLSQVNHDGWYSVQIGYVNNGKMWPVIWYSKACNACEAKYKAISKYIELIEELRKKQGVKTFKEECQTLYDNHKWE